MNPNDPILTLRERVAELPKSALMSLMHPHPKLPTFFMVTSVLSSPFLLASPSNAKIINVPCADGGGSAGWVHEANLPNRYYPMVLLGVSEMKPGQYPEHPMYRGADGGRTKYGMCAYSTSSD